VSLSDRDWALLVKNPDDYIGNAYTVWGCIVQFDAATGPDAFRAQAANRQLEFWFTDGENVYFTGLESDLVEFVEDDVVVMEVLSLGSYSYDTQIGGSTTVPAFFVNSIELRGSCQ
jgi:hypothetical protein